MNERNNTDMAPVSMDSEGSQEHQSPLHNQNNQDTNITLVHADEMPLDMSTLSIGTDNTAAPTETTAANNNNDSTNYESDYSDILDYDTEMFDMIETEEEDSDNSVFTPKSVLTSALFSSYGTTDGASESDSSTNADAGDNSPQTSLVVAGCQVCMLYIMVPEGTSACSRCGSPGLIVHFSGNGGA